MSDEQQLAALSWLHERFERERIDYWLFGGWAVDFHAGSVTRPHADLDVAVWLADHGRIAEILAAGGWIHCRQEDDDGSTTYERAGVRAELAFLLRDHDGEIFTPVRDGRAEWAPGAFGGEVAELRGVRARVIGLGSLKAEKSQPRDDERAAAKDRADLAVLSRLRRLTAE